MKKIINIFSIIIIVFSLLLISYVFIEERSSALGNDLEKQISTPTTPPLENDISSLICNSFTIDEECFIELEVEEGTLDQFTYREKLDQIKDWLVFAVLSESGFVSGRNKSNHL